jgi:hypothetical protein
MPMRRIADATLGNTPTTRVRRRISRLMRSMGIVLETRLQCSRGNAMKVSVSLGPFSKIYIALPQVFSYWTRSASYATSAASALGWL